MANTPEPHHGRPSQLGRASRWLSDRLKRVPIASKSSRRWAISALLLAACEEVPSDPDDSSTGGGAEEGGAGQGGAPLIEEGTPLVVEVNADRVYVDLDTLDTVGAEQAWDIAFEGRNILTNGGVSGEGEGAAFGPLSGLVFLADDIPEHPFLIEDRTGGAFLDWYDYDGQSHALYSRYHVHGVRRGDAHYKVQILGYYGEQQGAPVSALYQLRYARVDDEGVGATVVIENLDASAGGPSGNERAPSACVVLETQEVLPLTPAEASANPQWDLCFRRDVVSVNGGDSGPGGVLAVDLDRDAIATETLEEITQRTAASELAQFDAVDWPTLTAASQVYAADGVVSAFTSKWLGPGSDPLAPAEDATWLVAGADRTTPFLLVFLQLEGTTEDTLGTVHMRVKKLEATLP